MKFHVPPRIPWSSRQIASRLEAFGLTCRTDTNEVRILLPPIETRHFPLAWKKSIYNPEIRLTHREAKFFYNGELSYDVGKISFEEQIEVVVSVIEGNGFVLIPEDDISCELNAVLRYTPLDDEIVTIFNKLASLQELECQFVANQEFEKAFETLNAQNVIRDEVDLKLARRYGAPGM